MERWITTFALLAGACRFDAPAVGNVPDAAVDAPIDGPGPDVVVHVGAGDRDLGTSDLVIGSPVTIDTSGPTINVALPAGVRFAAAAQDGGGPELAILHVKKLSIEAAVRVIGARPLVVIADEIAVKSTLDAGARLGVAGPGAGAGGAGGVGAHFAPYTDSGPGGGGYGAPGAKGGDVACQACANNVLVGGPPGSAYNTGVAQLLGGSPGGRPYEATDPVQCRREPGAGGGAIQLYARTQIAISGDLNAGGGGGAGGVGVNANACGVNYLAGYGGGSGGAIVLQSPIIQVSGRVAANGGGGGSGGGEGLTGRRDGDAGDDGGLAGAAAGGAPLLLYSGSGGAGGAGIAAAGAGGNALASGNGGGGGGGVGQIVLLYRTRADVTGSISPAPAMKNY